MLRKRKKRTFLYNCDGEDHLSMASENPTPEEVCRIVYDPIENTQVDTITWSLGIGNVALWKSNTLGFIGEYNNFNFTNAIFYKAYANASYLLEQGYDIMDVVIEGGRRRNIDVFYSYRVNDVHDLWDSCQDIKPLFKKEHPEWLHDPEVFANRFGAPCTTALDFRRKEVRENRLKVISEIMCNHDFDGLELDLLRDNVYFDPGSAMSDAYCMTDFIRSIRALLDELGKKRGKYIELAARIPHTIIGAMCAGFDIETWARDQLVDIVIGGVGGNDGISPDTAKFREIFRNTDIGYYPCLNGWYETKDMTLDKTSDEVMLGVADQLWADQPDGIHTFNLYPTTDYRRNLLYKIGNPGTLKGINKTYITEQAGRQFNKHLPILLGETEHDCFSYTIRTADDHKDPVPRGARLVMKLENITDRDVFEVRFNGENLPQSRKENVITQSVFEPLCVWELEPASLGNANTVDIRLVKRNPFLSKFTPCKLSFIHLEVYYN